MDWGQETLSESQITPITGKVMLTEEKQLFSLPYKQPREQGLLQKK